MSLTLQEVTALKKLNSWLESAFKACVDAFVSVQLHQCDCGTTRFSLHVSVN